MTRPFENMMEMTNGKPGFTVKPQQKKIHFTLMGYRLFTIKQKRAGIKLYDLTIGKHNSHSLDIINKTITRHLSLPYHPSAWVMGRVNHCFYRLAPGICWVYDSEYKMIVDGEPCDIGGRVFKYSFEEACTELKKRSIPGEFETINKLAAVIRGHPDFSVRYDSVLFNPYGYNSSSGWVVLVVKVGGLFDIIDLFEGKTYEVSFDTAVDYLQKLMCLGPLADSVRIKHTFFCGVKCCAYPQFLIIGREKIVAAGDQYRLNGKTYIYSFEQFKRLVGEQ